MHTGAPAYGRSGPARPWLRPWKDARSWVLFVAASGAAASVACVTWAITARTHPYGQAVLWTALLLASFVGWGSVVSLCVAPGTRHDWGLRAGWGVAICVFLGGWLCLTHLASRVGLIALVGTGVAACFTSILMHGVRAWRRFSITRLRLRVVLAVGRPGPMVLVAIAYGAAAFLALATLGDRSFNQYDDPSLYMLLPERLVQTGSLFDPFAARRIPVMGGHVLLHALFLAVASPFYLNVVDGGLCVLVVMALLVGLTKGALKRGNVAPLAFVVLLFFALRSVRVNTGSIFSGLVAIATLYRTVRAPLATAASAPPWPMEKRRVALLAAVAATTFLLRLSLLGAALSFVALILASDFLTTVRRPWEWKSLRTFVLALAIAGGVVGLVTLPWSIDLHESCGTFFFPFGKNNLSPAVAFVSPLGWNDTIERLISIVLIGMPLGSLVPFLLAGLTPLGGRRRNDLVALTLSAILCMMSLSRAAFSTEDTSRYVFASVVSVALVAAASIRRSGTLATLVAVGVAVHVATYSGEWNSVWKTRLSQLHTAFIETPAARAPWYDLDRDYRDVQAHVRPGATMAVAVSDGFRFDFVRNKTFTFDSLGAMGPKPGWPLHKGPRALAEYLRDSGVNYVISCDFDGPGCFYNRSHTRADAAKVNSGLAPWAAAEADAEDSIQALPTVAGVAFVGHGMTVVDLGAPPK
ncbi:MAG TPA: hypothetical protein VII82_10005 [Polyangiaceae bacterium]